VQQEEDRAALEQRERVRKLSRLWRLREKDFGVNFSEEPCFCAVCKLEIVKTQPWFKCEDCSAAQNNPFATGSPENSHRSIHAAATKNNHTQASKVVHTCHEDGVLKLAKEPLQSKGPTYNNPNNTPGNPSLNAYKEPKSAGGLTQQELQSKAENIYICPICFSRGKGNETHQAGHAYRVMSSPQQHLFCEGWTIEDELHLLEGLELHGMDNWEAVSKYLGDEKSPEQVKNHYLQFYIFASSAGKEPGTEVGTLHCNQFHGSEHQQHDTKLFQHRDPDYAVSLDLVGYMPLRDEFDIEYQQTAELLLCDLQFSIPEVQALLTRLHTPSDYNASSLPQLSLLAKLRVIEQYNKKLDERMRRKQLAKERNYVDWRERHRKWLRGNRSERIIRAQMRPLEVFSSPEQHETIIQALVHEVELDQRLNVVTANNQTDAISARSPSGRVRTRSVQTPVQSRRTSRRQASAGQSRVNYAEDDQDLEEDDDDNYSNECSDSSGSEVSDYTNRQNSPVSKRRRTSSRIAQAAAASRSSSRRTLRTRSQTGAVDFSISSNSPTLANKSPTSPSLDENEDSLPHISSACEILGLSRVALEQITRQAVELMKSRCGMEERQQDQHQMRLRIQKIGDVVDVRLLP